MRLLHTSQAVVGQRVLYSGQRDNENVFDPTRLQQGHVLEHRHPGVIDRFYGPGKDHCIEHFVALEEEPISTAVGFDPDGTGHYRGLLYVTEQEWAQALSAGWWATPT